jgi:hypothetical protein
LRTPILDALSRMAAPTVLNAAAERLVRWRDDGS